MKYSSQNQLLDHSKAKVKLLGEYLKRYLNIISNDGYTKRIKIYDLFCGEGLYENGGEGSPLVIMNQVKELHFTHKAKTQYIPKIDCHFNDIDITKTEKAEKYIRNKPLYYDEIGDLIITNSDYTDLQQQIVDLQPILKQKNQKSFVFIDPYEYKHIRASQIKDLMKNGNAEVLLWLPTQFMYRFANNGTPEALKDFIEEVIPNFNAWRDAVDVWIFIEQLKKGFQNFLGERFFVDNFTIQKDKKTVYCLFFFTSHIRGFEKMLETKWEIDTEEGKGWTYDYNQGSLFHEQKTNPLEIKLIKFLKDNLRTNAEIYEFTLRQSFLTKHTNDILKNLQNNGKLSVELANGEKCRKGRFYNNYKMFKNDPNKVIFKLI